MRASFSNLLRRPAAVLLLAATVLAGCATPPTDPDELAAYKENNDPLEPMNRYFFEVNYGLDQLLIKPVAAWYNLILPAPVEQGVHNFLTNLNSPVIFANDAMQGNGPRAGVTAKRFLINSTLGVAGIFDVAAELVGPEASRRGFRPDPGGLGRRRRALSRRPGAGPLESARSHGHWRRWRHGSLGLGAAQPSDVDQLHPDRPSMRSTSGRAISRPSIRSARARWTTTPPCAASTGSIAMTRSRTTTRIPIRIPRQPWWIRHRRRRS